MKTSFYFVIWIIIYPILGLFNNAYIAENSFIVALAVVWGLSWLLNRLMPDTLHYERAIDVAPVLEDVCTGNLAAFIKRLRTATRIETILSIYFLVTTAVIAHAVFSAGVNDWIALIVFAFFTFGSISRAIKLRKALTSVRATPTIEHCAEIADEIYGVDCALYREGRQSLDYNQMLPLRPRYFKLFQIISIIIAGVCSVLGLLYIIMGASIMFRSISLEADAVGSMYLLYGSLAAYFGIKDFLTTLRALRSKG
jgi:hypothetical protein